MQFDFERDGFVHIRGAFPLDMLEEFEHTVMQMADRALTTMAVNPDIWPYPVDRLRALENTSIPEFFGLCSHAGGALSGLRLATAPSVWNVVTKAFGWNAGRVRVQPPFLFWNDARTKRLAYDWHQECSFYNGMPVGAHLWFPLFHNVNDRDGPMIVLPGSHKEKHPYTFEKPKDGVTQLHVSEDVVKRYPQHYCSAERGDAILFHHNLIHSTGENRFDRPRVAAVVRYIDAMAEGSRFHPLMECTFRAAAIGSIRADAAGTVGDGG